VMVIFKRPKLPWHPKNDVRAIASLKAIFADEVMEVVATYVRFDSTRSPNVEPILGGGTDSRQDDRLLGDLRHVTLVCP
jgi:uncharacterized protein YrrD